MTSDAVAPGAHCHQQLPLAREANRGDDIGDSQRAMQAGRRSIAPFQISRAAS